MILNRNKKLVDTIYFIDTDKRLVVGKCKAKDIRPEKEKENVFETLGIEWVDC